jgi:uncharacterized protein DUF6894
MPRYFFNLNDGRKIIPDLEGTELPDDDSARAHAAQVARELTRNREQETRSWRLAVCDAQGTLHFELLFASMDESISRLLPVIRFMSDDAGGGKASLNEALEQVRTTLLSYEDREGEDLDSARRRTQRRGLSQR